MGFWGTKCGKGGAMLTPNELVLTFEVITSLPIFDGDADAAMEARIRIGWNKFRQLVPLLTNKDMSLKVKGRLYSGCV